jgi:hypothetical protein
MTKAEALAELDAAIVRRDDAEEALEQAHRAVRKARNVFLDACALENTKQEERK